MRRSALVGGCWAALVALLFAPSAFAVEGPTLQDRIGAIAKTTLSPQGPETPGLLRGGLLDPAPEVRAAVARVARTMGARGLLPELRAALGQERVAETATEIEAAVKDLETEVEPETEQAPAVLPMRTLSGYPAEFFAAVLRATGCKGKADAFEVADIVFRASGRPKALQIVRTEPTSTDCNKALEILALSAVRSGRERFVRLVLPDQREFLACAALPANTAPARFQSDSGSGDQPATSKGTIKEPQKIKNRAPVYPASALQTRTQGVVIAEATISTTGCVQAISVLRSVTPALDAAAMNAVAAWVYTPTLLNGTPVPVIMTVTVNFRLN